MRRTGACPCGAVRFSIDGPVRDVVVCHCDDCQEATGGPWAASAAYRGGLAFDANALTWERAAASEHDARRGRCRACRTVVFWDAPERETVSFAVELLEDQGGLVVAAHIWVPADERAALATAGVQVTEKGLPASVSVPWHDETSAPGRSRAP